MAKCSAAEIKKDWPSVLRSSFLAGSILVVRIIIVSSCVIRFSLLFPSIGQPFKGLEIHCRVYDPLPEKISRVPCSEMLILFQVIRYLLSAKLQSQGLGNLKDARICIQWFCFRLDPEKSAHRSCNPVFGSVVQGIRRREDSEEKTIHLNHHYFATGSDFGSNCSHCSRTLEKHSGWTTLPQKCPKAKFFEKCCRSIFVEGPS